MAEKHITSAAASNSHFVGRVAFVTGAGSGIGRATALAFAGAGADVVVADVAERSNAQTAQAIQSLGARCLDVKCDVTNSNEVTAALEATMDAFGRLDAAFNNAGVEQPVKAAADLTDEEWDRLVAINLRGVFVCMKHQIPLMLRHVGGAIVNTSSGAGLKGFKGKPLTPPRHLRPLLCTSASLRLCIHKPTV